MPRHIGLRECVHCGKLVRGFGSVCPKCGKNPDKLDGVTRTQHINEVNALRSQNKLK